MKRITILPLMALAAFAVACSDIVTPDESIAFKKGNLDTGNDQSFHKANYTVLSSNGNLTLEIDHRGLGGFSTVNYFLGGDATIQWGCMNPGDNSVQGQPFNETLTDLFTDVDLTPRGGRVRDTIVIETGLMFDCGNTPHVPVLLQARWDEVCFLWDSSGDDLNGPTPRGDGRWIQLADGTLAGTQPTTTSCERPTVGAY
jgi:hypothetical protein